MELHKYSESRIGCESCGVEGYIWGKGRPRSKSWSLGCNVVGHPGQHEVVAAGTIVNKKGFVCIGK